jgi:ArsR family transcriptional regulator
MFSKQTKEILDLCSETRLAILKQLYFCQDEKCGCELIDQLDIPKNLLSYHLKIMENLGFIEKRRCGQRKYYQITKARKNKVGQLISILEIEKE